MDSRQAREILARYRPGIDDAAEQEVKAALGCVRGDADLGRWFEQHTAVQTTIRAKLKAITPPPGLKEQILAERQIIRVRRWQPWVAPLAVAAGLALLFALVWRPQTPATNEFAAFRGRMVRSGLRDYRMDVLTSDLNRVRDYLTRNQACGDFVLTKGLAKLPPLGCALRTWQGRRAAMVCFDQGRQRVLFLYVINRSAVPGAPAAAAPQFAQVSKLMTASWSLGEKTYVLAGQGDEAAFRQYLQTGSTP
jgi:hypothetical protein